MSEATEPPRWVCSSARPPSECVLQGHGRDGSGGSIPASAGGTRRRAGFAIGSPLRLEAADDIADAAEAQVDERRGRETRRETVVADEDDLPVEAADMRVPPAALRREPPLEHRARDVHGLRDDSGMLTVGVGADVDDQRAVRRGRERLVSAQAFDPAPRALEQLLEGEAWARRHEWMIRHPPRRVQPHGPARNTAQVNAWTPPPGVTCSSRRSWTNSNSVPRTEASASAS